MRRCEMRKERKNKTAALIVRWRAERSAAAALVTLQDSRRTDENDNTKSGVYDDAGGISFVESLQS
jgi:hypothetical protein